MTVFPTADSCGVLDVTPFGALHSASKRKRDMREPRRKRERELRKER